MPDIPRHVFVYGTLRRGASNDINRLLPAPRFLGLACVAGALYDLGAYPGVRLGGAGVVQGEVYAISAQLERRLDEIEEVFPQASGEYIKREVIVATPGHGMLPCLIYEVDASRIVGRPWLSSGDWLLGC